MPLTLSSNPMSFTSRGYSLEQAIDVLIDLGFHEIELCRPDISGCDTSALRYQLSEYVASRGKKLVGFNVADADDFQTLNEPDDVPSALASLKRDLDYAHDLGAEYISTWEGRWPEGISDDDRHGWLLDSTVDLFSQAADYAATFDIQVFVEVHPFTLGIDVAWLIKLCDRVNRNNFGVTYDPCHFGVGVPEECVSAIERLGSRIKCVHFSDSDTKSSELHFPPGRGCLDMDGIMAALRAIDYQGFWSVDVWRYPLPRQACQEGIAYLKKTWQEG